MCTAVVSLCRQVRDHAVALGSPKLAVSPLRDGLQKLAPTPEHVTPIHAEFALRQDVLLVLNLVLNAFATLPDYASVFCSCLQAKHYNAAALVLEQKIYDVDPAKTSMKPTDLLLYCYYGGMIHIGKLG